MPQQAKTNARTMKTNVPGPAWTVYRAAAYAGTHVDELPPVHESEAEAA